MRFNVCLSDPVFARTKWLHTILLALTFATFTGCSTVRIGYNQADVILAWRADDYFDFDSQQKQEFGKRLARLLDWHRRDQLPEYAAFLTEIRQRAQRRPTRDDAAWIVEGVKARFRNIVNRGVNDAADTLVLLKPENIRALEHQIEKDNKKFVREYRLDGSMEQRKHARLEHTLKQIKNWTGSLTHEQEERIAALNNAIPSIDHLRHQDRQRRQREFLAILRLRDNKPEFLPLLHNWLLHWERGRAPDYVTQLDDVFNKRIALFLEVERMLTPQQREHVLRKLQDYIDDMKVLAAQPAAVN
jgi:hypothetical protein